MTSIGNSAFAYCGITDLIIPNTVTTVGAYAFRGCSQLKNVLISHGLSKIANECFYYCESLQEIVIPDGISDIGDYAFYNCSSLKRIVLPDSVERIDEHSFEYCPSDIVVFARCGSYASQYCLQNGLRVESNQHTPVADAGYAPAYGVNGLTDGSHCAVCGTVLVPQQVIPALTYQEVALPNAKNNGTITVAVG
ncbi:MAG: leucine-rich repeat domain-containing protein [Clostridia bacterium]|nr:leucine-rich repeat domain-containing protein [Clostridia bacterium]